MAEAEGVAEAEASARGKATGIDTSMEWTTRVFSLPPDLEGSEPQEQEDEQEDGAKERPKKGPKPGSWKRCDCSEHSGPHCISISDRHVWDVSSGPAAVS